MSCNGQNDLLDAAKGMKDSMKGLMEAGAGALGDLQSKLGELEAKLGEFKPTLPENPSLQDLVNKLGSATDGTAFAETYATIKEKFGKAWEDMDAKLEEMGLGKFPPTLDATASFLKTETGIDINALMSGDLSSLQAKIDEAVAAGQTPPNLTAILAGDYSSLGVDMDKINSFMADPTKAICDVVPKLEEVNGQAVSVPNASTISTAIADLTPAKIQSSMSEYSDNFKVLTTANKNAVTAMNKLLTEKIMADTTFDRTDDDFYDWYKNQLNQVLRKNYAADHAEIMGIEYREWIERRGKAPKISMSILPELNAKIDIYGIDPSFLYLAVAEEFNTKTKYAMSYEEFYVNYFNNMYPVPENNY